MSLASFLKRIAFHRSSDSGIVLLPAPSHPCGHWLLPVSYPHTAAGPLPVLTGFSLEWRHPPQFRAFQGMENVNGPNIALQPLAVVVSSFKNGKMYPSFLCKLPKFRIFNQKSQIIVPKKYLLFSPKGNGTPDFFIIFKVKHGVWV